MGLWSNVYLGYENRLSDKHASSPTAVTVCSIYVCIYIYIYYDIDNSNGYSIILFQKNWTRFDLIYNIYFFRWTDVLSRARRNEKKYPKYKCLDTIVGYSFIYYHFGREATFSDFEYRDENVTEICEIQLLFATLLRVEKVVPRWENLFSY